MEALYSGSVPIISGLQKGLFEYESTMALISNLLDPRYAFYIYTPLLYAFDQSFGKQLLWASVLAEWTNQILKWLLHGHRPYWYVQIAPDAEQLARYPITQFPPTCETGPGSPSGHAEVTTVVFYMLIAYALSTTKCSRRTRFVAWTGLFSLVLLVSISRIFLAAHFPHQCVLGALLGLLVLFFVRQSRNQLEHLNRMHYILATIFLGATAMITRQIILPLLGAEGDWSVTLAQKFCNNAAWVHLDTSPLFSLMRYTGFLLGFGLGLHSTFNRNFNRVHFNKRMRFATAMISISIAKASELIPKPGNLYALYLFGFCLSAGLAYIYTAIAPLLVIKCTPKVTYRKTSVIDNC